MERHRPLVLPAAHDALIAKLIERAGFPAYQVGRFALAGARFGRHSPEIRSTTRRLVEVIEVNNGR